MATTSNLFSGNGSTTAFTITFPYINTTDVKAKVGGSAVTNFSVSGQTVTFSSAPASGSSNVEIFRETDNNTIRASFQSGSSLRAADFNDNFTQVLYVSQESDNDAADAVTSADAAVATANTASTNATNAVNTANTASTNASTALSTANTANSTANTASTNASTALSTANTASTNATNAVSTANTASTNASNAVTTANSANSTANTASTNASNAVTTANAASATATAAQTAVANAVLYTPVANVAAIPGSPSDGDYVEVLDSTGIESFSPLSGLPSGFVGASGLTVKLKYVTNSWVWQQYFATDSETRYINAGAGAIVNADVNASAAIALSKLATGALPSAITVASANITDGTIVNADVNASAAIAGSKISPDFGSQNVVTTGTSTSKIVKAQSPAGVTTDLIQGFGGTSQVFAVDESGNVTIGSDVTASGTTNITLATAGTIDLKSALSVSGANTPTGRFSGISRFGSLLIGSTSEAVTDARCSIDAGNGNITTSGGASVGTSGAFSIDSSGVIQTNISSSGHIKLDSSGSFGSPKIDLRSNTGLGMFGGGQFNANVTPSSGSGVEVFKPSSTQGQISSYNRDTSAWMDLIIKANTQQFFANGTERMRIKSDGKVGIGTSSPASPLHIVGPGTANGVTLDLNDSSSGAASQHIRITRGANIASLGIEGSQTGDPFFIQRSTNYTDFMINGSGHVGIGKLPTTKLDVNGATHLDSGMLRVRNTSTNGTLNVFTSQGAATNKNLILGQHSVSNIDGTGASLCFLVKSNGDTSNTNNSYGAISDINLKENIRDIESQWDDVKAVRLVKYEFKDKEAYGEGDRLGVIAQELEKISPSLVVDDIHTKTSGDESEEVTTKSVKYSVLTLKFMGALQEAMQRIEVLEQRLAELET